MAYNDAVPESRGKRHMRNRVLGAVGVLWGGAMVAHWWFAYRSSAASDTYPVGYQAGQAYAVVFGAVLFLTGLYYLFKKSA